jgi:hypothetical protein
MSMVISTLHMDAADDHGLRPGMKDLDDDATACKAARTGKVPPQPD